jgi:predicted  nucleic acid-binding Zn-ribbon protein
MTTTTQDSEIDRLAALQALDCQLKEKADEQVLLLREAEGFEAQLALRREELAQLRTEHATTEAQRAELDSRLEAEGAKVRDNRMRLNRVRNERELAALQREIDLGKEANQQLEEQLLVLMEKVETLATRVTAGQEAIEQLEARFGEEVTTRRERARSLRQEVDAQRSRREALAGGMNPSLRSKYEQIFERRQGTAVVAVRQGVCLGCHMGVPPQMYNELQKFRDIRQCPNCYRILYYRPEPRSEAQ